MIISGGAWAVNLALWSAVPNPSCQTILISDGQGHTARLAVELHLEKISDCAEFAGVASALMVNDQVVHPGGSPSAKDLAHWLPAKYLPFPQVSNLALIGS
jgi:hypothetical protein